MPIMLLLLTIAAPGSAASAHEPAVPITAHDLIGRWASHHHCGNSSLSYLANGTWLYADGSHGRWALDGDVLTTHTAGVDGPTLSTVHLLADGSILRTRRGHRTARLRRCPAARVPGY